MGDVNISALLNSFQMGYDKRVRPNYGGPSIIFYGDGLLRFEPQEKKYCYIKRNIFHMALYIFHLKMVILV